MEDLIEKHLLKFKVAPYEIGLFWNDEELFKKELSKSIETNKPYNEYELLSKEEQKAFDKGELVF